GALGVTPSDRRFVFARLPTIEGYIDALDALVFAALLRCQGERGLKGGLVDVGVFFGRSYLLLRHMAALDENVLAIDLFDDPAPLSGKSGQFKRFLDHGKRLGLSVDERLVIAADSSTVRAADILKKVGDVRFFAVDGGHRFLEVASDARLARECLLPHGIIAFDDTFNPRWPDVTVAVAAFIEENAGDFAVFCITRFHTYVCRRAFHEAYRAAIETSRDLDVFRRETIDFMGAPTLFLQVPMPRRILHEVALRMKLGLIADWAYRA
ncbi:hypothetical protein COL154_014328, partial [Colletotrichum chrysophilum]